MKIGFIGAGNMASAIIGGLTAKRFVQADEIAVYDVSQAQMQKAVDQFSVHAMAAQEGSCFKPVSSLFWP